MKALAAEAALRAPHFANRFSLVHAGTRDSETESAFKETLTAVDLSADTPIFWSKGAAPSDGLLRAIRDHDIDLLIAGALEKERDLHYYLGSVARKLVREAPCSLLLLTNPAEEPEPFRKLVVVTDYSESSSIALSSALRLAAREHAEQVFVLRVLSSYGEAIRVTDGGPRGEREREEESRVKDEEALLTDFVDAAGYSTVPVEPVLLQGHPGRTTSQFTRRHQADLLVMPSATGPHHLFERLFPSQMEWVLREIPCNLWVVRK